MTRSRALGRCVLLVLAIGLLSIGVAAPLAGAAGAAGSGAALQDDGATADDPDVTIDVDELDGHSLWTGQTVALEGFESDETVTFTHASGFRQRTADADGRLVTDTSQWVAGTWSVTANESGAEGSFDVREQTLDASVEPTAASESTTLTADSNRAGPAVVVDADGLTTADLAAVVDGGSASDGQFRLPIDDGTHEVAIDAAALHAGEYEFEVAATDTGTEATATLNVTSPLRLGDHEPTSPDDVDGLYLDVDGDGSVGQGDVATFFRQQHRSAWKRPSLFDFSRNGRVTHGDVVTLFDYVATGRLPAEPDATFVDGPYDEHEGDVAEIPVAVEGTDEAWVNVTLLDYDYEATVHLEDLDGETTIDANTFLIGHDEAEGTFAGEDVAGVTETGDLARLEAESRFRDDFAFRLRTFASDPTDGDARTLDVSRLTLDDRSTDDLTTYAAPAGTLEGDVETPGDLLDDATQRASVAEGDVLIADVEASGIYGYLQSDAATYNDTADGIGDLAFTVSTAEDTPVGPVERTEDLADLEGAELLVDEDDDRFLVAVPTDELAFAEADAAVGAGDSVDVGFEVGDGNPYVADGEDETVSRTVTLEPAVEFADAQYAEHEGDVAEIPVTVDGLANRTDDAWIELTIDEHDYAATVQLADVENRTTVEANTFLMGQGGADGAFAGEDVAGFVERGEYAELSPEERFEDGLTFDLRTYTTDPADGASVHDEAELTLEDRSTGNLTTYVAPAGTLDDGVDVDSLTAAAPESEIASVPEDASDGDVIVAEVEASGVYGYLQGEASSYDATAGGAGDLSIALTTEQETAFGPEVFTEDLADLEGARLLLDEDEDRFFVAIDAADVAFENYAGVFGAGDEFDVAFEVGNESPYADDGQGERATGSYSLDERTLEIDGDYDENGRLVLPRSSNVELKAETTVAPGTEVVYFVETQDDIFHGEVVVRDNGTAATTVDLSDVDEGDIVPSIEFEVDGDAMDATEGVAVAGDASAEFVASGTTPTYADLGESVELDTYVENQGLVSGVRTVTVTVDGEVVESAPLELAPDEIRSQSYELPTDEVGEVEWEIQAGGSRDSGTFAVDVAEP